MNQLEINVILIAISIGVLYLVNKYQINKLKEKLNELIKFVNDSFETHRNSINRCDEQMEKLTKFVNVNLKNHREAIESIDKTQKRDKNMGEDYKKIIETKTKECVNELNEIMFGSPPLKNKLYVVRNIQQYDYSLYRKDIDGLNDLLKDGWSVVNATENDFTYLYLLGKPLSWCKDVKEM